MEYSIYFVYRELESHLSVKSTSLLSEIVSYYLSNVGLTSATFYLQGNQNPLNTNSASATVAESRIRDNSRIFIKNAIVASLDNSFSTEISVHDSNGSMGKRSYLTKSGTSCKFLIKTLRCTLGEQRHISLFSNGRIVDEDHIISKDEHFDAICY